MFLVAIHTCIGVLGHTLLCYCQQLVRVVAMGLFAWLVDGPLMKVEWRSVSVECGGQCVTLVGVAVMSKLCADNWGFHWTCLAQVGTLL